MHMFDAFKFKLYGGTAQTAKTLCSLSPEDSDVSDVFNKAVFKEKACLPLMHISVACSYYFHSASKKPWHPRSQHKSESFSLDSNQAVKTCFAHRAGIIFSYLTQNPWCEKEMSSLLSRSSLTSNPMTNTHDSTSTGIGINTKVPINGTVLSQLSSLDDVQRPEFADRGMCPYPYSRSS